MNRWTDKYFKLWIWNHKLFLLCPDEPSQGHGEEGINMLVAIDAAHQRLQECSFCSLYHIVFVGELYSSMMSKIWREF